MTKPFLSIIIPSYNQGAYIENTLLSIIKQDFRDWEILIQDGASKDQTAEKVAPYASADSRITFQSEKDKGFSDAVNKAIDRCHGEYAIIQNSDDFFSGPNVLTRAASIFKEYKGLHLLSANFMRVDTNMNELIVPPEVHETGFIDPNDIYILKKNFGQSSTFFSLQRAREIGKLNGKVDMVADTDFWIRMSNYAPVEKQKIYYVNENWSYATFHPDQRSADPSKFWIGRAKMFTDFVFDPRMAVDDDTKKSVALLFVLDAFEYLNARKKPTDKPEEMYKDLTGESIPVKRQIKKFLVKFPILQKLVTRNSKIDGTDYFLSLPRGKNVAWFNQH